MNFKKLQTPFVLLIIVFCIRAFHRFLDRMNVYPDLVFGLTVLTFILGVIGLILLIRQLFFLPRNEEERFRLECTYSDLKEELKYTHTLISAGESVLQSKHTTEEEKLSIREGIDMRKKRVLYIEKEIDYIEKCIKNLQ